MKTVLIKSALAGVILLSLAAGETAGIRVWTDSTGNHSVSASFVSIDGDKVLLKRASGEPVTLPLARLSEDDQAIARQFAGATPSASSSGQPSAGEVRITAKGELRRNTLFVNGEKSQTQEIVVKVTLQGGTAAIASAIGLVTAEPITVDGQQHVLSPLTLSEYFEPIDRKAKGGIIEHPKDGITLKLVFGNVKTAVPTVGPLKGTVVVLAGAKEHELYVDDLNMLADGPLDNPVLAKAGIKASYGRSEKLGKTKVWVAVEEENRGSFLDMKVIGADGKNVGGFKATGRSGTKAQVSLNGVDPAKLSGARLVLNVREGGEKVTIPFHVPSVSIKK